MKSIAISSLLIVTIGVSVFLFVYAGGESEQKRDHSSVAVTRGTSKDSGQKTEEPLSKETPRNAQNIQRIKALGQKIQKNMHDASRPMNLRPLRLELSEKTNMELLRIEVDLWNAQIKVDVRDALRRVLLGVCRKVFGHPGREQNAQTGRHKAMLRAVQEKRLTVLTLAPSEIRRVSFKTDKTLEFKCEMQLKESAGLIRISQVGTGSSISGSSTIPLVSRAFMPTKGWIELEIENQTKVWARVTLQAE